MQHYLFPGALFFEVRGRDAARYLNSRLSNDIRGLAVSHVLEAAVLTPQGKIEGLFRVHRVAEESFMLVCDGGALEQVLAAFKRYLVADRVEVIDRSREFSLCHFFNCEPLRRTLDAAGVAEGHSTMVEGVLRATLCRRSNEPGVDVVGSCAELSKFLTNTLSGSSRALTTNEYFERRFDANVVSFPEELNDQVLLLEAPLEHALSHNKGCYVGQEVIEKISSRGKAPRRVVRLQSASKMAVGDAVFARETSEKASAPDRIGEVVSSMCQDQILRSIAFAFIRDKDYAPGAEFFVKEDPVVLV